DSPAVRDRWSVPPGDRTGIRAICHGHRRLSTSTVDIRHPGGSRRTKPIGPVVPTYGRVTHMPSSVVSVINYKGGVGKTTLTANIGADLAARGRRVLLVDLDPQASLTFSFYRPSEWEEQLAGGRTVLHWFDSYPTTGVADPLRKYVVSPPAVNALVERNGGRLDLLASHLGLIEIDLDLAAGLGGARYQKSSPRYVPVHRLLADALRDEAFAAHDVVLIDCAPNFNMVT